MSPKKKTNGTLRERVSILEIRLDSEKETQQERWENQESVNRELKDKSKETQDAITEKFTKQDRWNLIIAFLLLLDLFFSDKLYDFVVMVWRLF